MSYESFFFSLVQSHCCFLLPKTSLSCPSLCVGAKTLMPFFLFFWGRKCYIALTSLFLPEVSALRSSISAVNWIPYWQKWVCAPRYRIDKLLNIQSALLGQLQSKWNLVRSGSLFSRPITKLGITNYHHDLPSFLRLQHDDIRKSGMRVQQSHSSSSSSVGRAWDS